MGIFSKDDDQYKTEVNEGAINMRALTAYLNDHWRDGWRLHSVFEQSGNTCMVFERRT